VCEGSCAPLTKEPLCCAVLCCAVLCCAVVCCRCCVTSSWTTWRPSPPPSCMCAATAWVSGQPDHNKACVQRCSSDTHCAGSQSVSSHAASLHQRMDYLSSTGGVCCNTENLCTLHSITVATSSCAHGMYCCGCRWSLGRGVHGRTHARLIKEGKVSLLCSTADSDRGYGMSQEQQAAALPTFWRQDVNMN